jgi:membrane associated rhomboid family serine protease
VIPVRDDQVKEHVPLVTWTLALLNVVIFLWDRQGVYWGPNVIFADLAMRPRDVVEAVTGRGDGFALVTLFTSVFMHGSLMHLLGNLIFLVVFGSAVENAMGPFRFTIYYLAWGVAASGAQIYVDPASTIMVLGASGAIGGVLGAYFLLFPSSKIEIIVPILAFLSFEVAAWVLLGLWFLWQILVPQPGVATWAHAGGFLAGMITVLVMGGRHAVLRREEGEYGVE